MSTQSLKPPGNSRKSDSGTGNSNFAKALLEAGGHTVQSTVDAGVSMASDALASLFGAGGNIPSQPADGAENLGQQTESSMFHPEQQEAEWKKREMQILRHREVQQTEVFNARQVETTRKIDQILVELEALAKDLDDADRQAREAQIAVMQGAVHGGDYHVTFFEKLLKTIVMLRQRVRESASWLSMFNTRQAAKGKKGYWNQFHANGTQWAMSSERAIATSVG